MGDRTAELERIVRTLATPAGRMVGTAGHEEALAFLLSEIQAHDLAGYHDLGSDLAYEHAGQSFSNLLGVLPGRRPELPPVLLAAHYDTCGPFPGADDNAAGIAVLFDLVEPLRRAPLDRSVIFAFFDAEEPPYFFGPSMGSTWFYERQRREEIHCALVLDLVGHDVPVPGWEDLVFVTGMESDPGLEPVVLAAEERAHGIRMLPTLTRYVGDRSDYRAFRLDRRPYLFFSCAEWPHYHMPTDTPERLNYTKMASFADTLLAVTQGVAATTLEGPFEGYDTTATELRSLRAVGGPLLERLGASPKGRAELDELVPHLGHILRTGADLTDVL